MSTPKRKVLVTGANGQLGRELRRTAPVWAECVACDTSQLDICNSAAVADCMTAYRPYAVINAAAYTAVDRAESEPDKVFAVNRDGAGNVAREATRTGARVIHISTDFVFDGTKSSPYLPGDAPNPINVYGSSKLAGERAVAQASDGKALIVRTAWVYSAHGQNFVKTVLRLLKEKQTVRVVSDQIGSPTHAAGLAGALWRILETSPLHEVLHWTDAGVASWYDFASAIRRHAASCLGERAGVVMPIPSADYPTPARRPQYGVLDKGESWRLLGPAKHWEDVLQAEIGAIVSASVGAA